MERRYASRSRYTFARPSRVARRPRRASSMRRVPRPEVKRLTATFNETITNLLTGAINSNRLTTAQGTNDYERIGNRILPVGVRVRGFVNNVTTGREVLVRCALVTCKVAGDAVNTVNFFDPNTASALVPGDGESMAWPINLNRFVVHYDKTFIMGNGTVTGGVATIGIDEFIRMPRTPQLYEGTTASDITQGDLRWLMWAAQGDSDAATAGTVEATVSATLLFTDI